MPSPNRNKFIIASLILLPVIVSLVVFVFINNRGPNQNPDEFFDPGSGETVSDPINKSPEAFGVDSSNLTYLGFSKLLDFGVTSSQLDLIKSIFNRFSTTSDRYITELSITTETIDQTFSGPNTSLAFELTANRTTKYTCIISYSGLSDARVLVSSTGQQVFDSNLE